MFRINQEVVNQYFNIMKLLQNKKIMCTFKLPSGLKSVIFHVSAILILKLKKICVLNLYINNMDSVV